MRDLHNNIRVENTVLPQVGTADINGSTVDRQGYEAVEHVAHVGATGDTLVAGTRYFDIKLEDGTDGTNFVAVTDANDVLVDADSGVSAPDANGVIATIDGTDDDETKYRIGYRGNKRYSRLVFDFTGTHANGTPVSALAIKSHGDDWPLSDA